MTSPPGCPGIDRLKAMLNGTLREAEQTLLVGHLDHCESCQRAVEAVEEAWTIEGAWPRRAPSAPGENQGLETEFLRAMEWLKGRPSEAEERDEAMLAEEPSLDFLGPPSKPGHLGTLGPYAVLGVIGRGGMGMVLKAFDPSLHRLVAIKVLAPQLATSAAARKRFAREARAAAAVSHEHVVAIHAVDEVGGSPYLVMEYVAGCSLQERLDQTGSLELKEILRIGMQAAAGLAAAHTQGLIHRDIKPSNILLENHIERVKITDFGLARTVDDASLTQSGVLAGTPQYMAPEQAHGEVLDQRTDLFSLGSVLYAMGAGRPPFRASSAMAVLRRVCEESPRPLREVNPEISDDLAEVITKLLSKNPGDRFSSAAEVAQHLGKQLAALQQSTRRDAETEKPMPDVAVAKRLPRRAIAALLLLVAAFGITEATAVTNVSSLVATILRVRTPSGTLVLEVDDPKVQVSVDGDEIVITGAGVHQLRLKPGRHRIRATRDGVPVHEELVTISKGGKQVAKVTLEASVWPEDKRKAQTPQVALKPKGDEDDDEDDDEENIPALDSHDKRDALKKRSGEEPKQHEALAAEAKQGDIPSWMISPRKVHPSVTLDGKTGLKAAGVAYAPNGKLLAMSSFEAIKLWDLAKHEELATLRNDQGDSKFGDWQQVVWSLAFSPDGKTLAAASFDGTVSLWDVEARAKRTTLTGHVGPDPEWPDAQVWKVAFSPDGTLLASASWDGTARLWEVAAGKERKVFKHPGKVRTLAFSPDGKTLVTGMGSEPDRNVRFWNVETGRETGTAMGNIGGTLCMAVSPDGKTLATGGQDARVKLWDPATGLELATLTGHSEGVESLAFSPDGRWLTSISGNYRLPGKSGEIRIWDVATAQPRMAFDDNDGPLHGLAYAPDGRSFATTGLAGTVKIWAPDLKQQAQVAQQNTLRPRGTLAPLGGRGVACLAIAADGKTLAAGSYQYVSTFEIESERRLLPRDNSPGEPHHAGWVMALAFAANGKELASSGTDATVARIDPSDGRVRERLSRPYTTTYSIAYVPGGQDLLVTRRDNFVDSWSLDSPKPKPVLSQYRPGNLIFAGNGKLLATSGDGDPSGTVRLISWPSGQESLTLTPGGSAEVTCLAFSPGGKTLAVGLTGRFGDPQNDGSKGPAKKALAAGEHGLLLWRLANGHLQDHLVVRAGRISGVAFSPDGRWLAAVGGDPRTPESPGFAWLWNLSKLSHTKPAYLLKGHEGAVHAVAFTPDSKTLVTGGADATVKLWDLPEEAKTH